MGPLILAEVSTGMSITMALLALILGMAGMFGYLRNVATKGRTSAWVVPEPGFRCQNRDFASDRPSLFRSGDTAESTRTAVRGSVRPGLAGRRRASAPPPVASRRMRWLRRARKRRQTLLEGPG